MSKPNVGDPLTQEQINQALNIDKFESATPDKGWHEGLFEPWALEFGYPDGKPIYAGVVYGPGSKKAHIYYLNDGNKALIILLAGQKPQDYGVEPKD